MSIERDTDIAELAKEVRKLRFVLTDAGGNLLAPDSSNEYAGIVNVNSRDPYCVSAQVLCDLDHWHEIGRTPLPPWTP
jgi:hypothetical protein